ncbi:SIR2 family NAD-dependent protein deacylase [Changchengzhania lutea]|uniref:SIR2 family NAD-dependent protein deacylase n=1 Tax=Changchengzhania lutea TaxID=2049305 RepID=UPI00115E8A20|nr:NAD-dependent deacylase [Changchengzhania lutea]
MKNLVILTGAGMSAESGLKTFRDANGLWEGHDVLEVATPQGFEENPELVLEFYNQRRRQLLDVKPNTAHLDLVKLEERFKVSIITQNVDDLHERAGSTNVIHLHGELLKVRSIGDIHDVKEWHTDLNFGDTCANGHQLRPHIVWFGEDVPMIEKAMTICEKTDLLLIIGTSMQVYPAAGLINYVPKDTPMFLIDPSPNINNHKNLTIIAENVTIGMKEFLNCIN